MIPIALTAPPAPRAATSPVGSIMRAVAILALLAAVAGLFTWTRVLSPLSFRRWNSAEIVADLHVDHAGTYVLYEEFPGAAGDAAAQAPHVTLRSSAGRKVDATSLLDGDGRSSLTYHVFMYEGRAVASFTIDRPGDYEVSSFGAAAPRMAFAPDGRPGFLGGMAGLILVVVVPLVVALAAGLTARRRWPRGGVDARHRS